MRQHRALPQHTDPPHARGVTDAGPVAASVTVLRIGSVPMKRISALSGGSPRPPDMDVMRRRASIRPMGPTGGIGVGGWLTARHRSAVIAALAALALVGLLYLELALWDISSGLFSVEGTSKRR